MRIGSAPDLRQRLLFMLAAAQREPALIRRRKQRPWIQEGEEPLSAWAHTDQQSTPGSANEEIGEHLA